ncbi:class I SAM-dependent methyltransferase [Sulfitobacter sp. F26204]|uniref:class I SAM-dependent methyltransferase n=1 Tax=Sulfitobacter sp. F26204 TaxID=2996014 RepID=UPI00225DF651|nr:class I SAM-dependent methyltransferase [Sulfitobacter sp. F26204]MCX7560663.1 class I SAM-dependent methyltransferase [Sulfitobacter sp. F26204]
MALPDTLAARLIETVKDNDLSGNFVMLGRQRWVGKRRKRSAMLLDEVLAKYLPGTAEKDLQNTDDEYSETFFQKLGFTSVDSLDFSNFENATIIQDLSADLPQTLNQRFDVIYDGGTCEHIFDLPTAYRNIDKMLKPGGVLIGHSPCNNWVNHSFYQINPEMVYGFWEKAMGYEVLHCDLQPLMPMHAYKVVATTNPNITGKRPRLSGKLSDGGIILNYAVRKPLKKLSSGEDVYQTDYQNRWRQAAE